MGPGTKRPVPKGHGPFVQAPLAQAPQTPNGLIYLPGNLLFWVKIEQKVLFKIFDPLKKM